MFYYGRVTMYPRLLQKSMLLYSTSEENYNIRFAPESLFGIMGESPFVIERLKSNVAKDRVTNNNIANDKFYAGKLFLSPRFVLKLCLEHQLQ